MEFLIFFVLLIIAIKLGSLHTTLKEILVQIKIWNGDISDIQRDVNTSANIFFEKSKDRQDPVGTFWSVKKKVPLDDSIPNE